MLFTSEHEDINIPTRITVWDFLFSSSAVRSPVSSLPSSPPSFINTTTRESITHTHVAQQSIHLSTSLTRTLYLKPGEVVSIVSANSICYPLALFGIMRVGGLPALSSPGFTVEEMTHAFQTAKSRFVFTSKDALSMVKRAASIVGIQEHCIFVLDGEVDGFRSLQAMIKEGSRLGDEHQVREFEIPRDSDNSKICAVLCFSSGTTGLSKAVMISHQNLIAQCLQLLPTTSDDHKTVLGLLPFYHITGVVKLLVLPITISASVVIPPAFTLQSFLEVISTYRIAEVQVVPPIIIRLVHDPLVEKYDLSCVKRFASGAAPVSEGVLALLQQRFPGRGFKQGYGMTESCGCISTHPLDKHDFAYARTGGTLVANTQVKVVNEKGQMVGVDEKGEILAKGPQIFMGYANNPQATASAFDADGFLRTGDEGSISAAGLVTIHDRIKEMIKVKGVQVAPAELEDLLLGNPRVEDCAVIGVADEYSGERPLGFVVLKKMTNTTKTLESTEDAEDKQDVREEILRFVRERKAKPKWLLDVRFVEEIPKSASGKILRRLLRSRVRAEEERLKAKL